MNLEGLEVSRKILYSPFENNNNLYFLSNYPYMDIVLHDYCNSKCKFCVASLMHDRALLPLTPKTKSKIDFAIDQMGVKEVLLLGGEPTLIDDSLFWVIDYLKTFNLNKICMTTNGQRLAQDPEFAKKLCSSGLTHLNLSIMTFDVFDQTHYSGKKFYFKLEDLIKIHHLCREYGVTIRINTNVFLGNNDSKEDILTFYSRVKPFCDNVKFSSLLKTDVFSTINEVTEFNKTHTLSHEAYDDLFKSVEEYFADYPLIINNKTLGFVKNTLINLPVPIIFNYNHSGQLMKMFTERRLIHGVKLLPTGDLSYSWNREAPQYFINTKR